MNVVSRKAAKVRPRRLHRGPCVALGLALLPSVAAAEPAPVAVRLEWGSSVCGGSSGFASRVLQRTRRVRFVEDGADVSVRSSIEPKGTLLEARVVIETAGRALLTRSIESPDCDDALDALALVLAISLEAHSRESPARRHRPRTLSAARARAAVEPRSAVSPAPAPFEITSGEPAVGSAGAEPPADAARGGAPGRDGAPPAPAASTDPGVPSARVAMEGDAEDALAFGAPGSEQPRPAADSGGRSEPEGDGLPSGLRFGAGIAAGLASGVGPEPMLGGGLWATARHDLGGLWSPALSVGFGRVVLEAFPQTPAEADFVLDSGQLAFCPLRLAAAELELRPCIGGALGRLRATGNAPFFSERAASWWTTVAGSLEGSLAIAPLLLRATFDLSAPLVRPYYRFGPPCAGDECQEGVFHRPSAVTMTLGLGVGIAF